VFDLKRGVKYILLPKRKVDIVSYKDIKVEKYEDGIITMSGEIEVSSGTYIRKLVEDITENSLSIFSYLSKLSRKYDRDSILKAISQIKT
jgi:tRNA U55 pseudouridine synthase TruB